MSEEKFNIPDDLTLISPNDLRRAVWSADGTRVMLSLMTRLGFWPKERTLEDLEPPEEQNRLKELQEEISRLRIAVRKYGNEEAVLKEIRKEMWDESKKRRAEKKERKEKEKEEKRKAWEEKKKDLVLYLGEGVSGGLSNETSDREKLESLSLPVITTPIELAQNIGISLSKLRWLTYHRNCTTICHYYQFTIPKKRGGERKLSSPKPILRTAQSWVKEAILDKISPHEVAHGFIKERSILSNAMPHTGNAVVVNMDIKDFFPSVTFKRVKGMFRSFGYSESLSILLALLCTEPPVETVRYKDRVYNVSLGQRCLPQGACTSPAVTNIICTGLDKRLKGKADALGFNYTRYADDMTFSGNSSSFRDLGKLLKDVTDIVSFEGFLIHPDKTRIFHKSRRQEVTGLVVNRKPGINRKDLKKFRAILHNCEKNGIEGQNLENHTNFIAYLRGYCSFISMIDQEKGKNFLEQLDRICKADE